MELSQTVNNDLMARLPTFELSYEMNVHKKVSPSYNVCFAIPQGKKCYIWFTYIGEKNVCLLLHLNKEKKITKTLKLNVEFDKQLSLGTIFYGTLVDGDEQFFVVEDIFYYRGICLKKSILQEKLDFLFTILSVMNLRIPKEKSIAITLPVIWENQHDNEFECNPVIPENIKSTIGYPVHHIQYRCFLQIAPFLNVPLNRNFQLQQTSATATQSTTVEPKKIPTLDFETEEFTCDFSKPQYKYPTVFKVTADIQFDIYHLYAYGKNGKPTYYGLASIPNYKSSVFMNGLFRNIKENRNLDYIEESDDEEEFENMEEDRFVDISKVLLMECSFSMRTKKWVPHRVVDNSSKYIHIAKLSSDRQPNNRYIQPRNGHQQRQYQQNGYRKNHYVSK